MSFCSQTKWFWVWVLLQSLTDLFTPNTKDSSQSERNWGKATSLCFISFFTCWSCLGATYVLYPYICHIAAQSHLALFISYDWKMKKRSLDNIDFLGVLLSNIYMHFDCILHDLLIQNLHVYNFDKDGSTFVFDNIQVRK